MASIPTSVTLTVDSVVINSVSMTIGEDTYDRVAIVCLSADRDDVRFNQIDDDTELLIGVNWYGMLLFPYKSSATLSSISVPINITCAGITVEDDIDMDDLITVGTTLTLVLTESDDSGNDSGNDAGGGGT